MNDLRCEVCREIHYGDGGYPPGIISHNTAVGNAIADDRENCEHTFVTPINEVLMRCYYCGASDN